MPKAGGDADFENIRHSFVLCILKLGDLPTSNGSRNPIQSMLRIILERPNAAICFRSSATARDASKANFAATANLIGRRIHQEAEGQWFFRKSHKRSLSDGCKKRPGSPESKSMAWNVPRETTGKLRLAWGAAFGPTRSVFVASWILLHVTVLLNFARLG